MRPLTIFLGLLNFLKNNSILLFGTRISCVKGTLTFLTFTHILNHDITGGGAVTKIASHFVSLFFP